MRAGIGEMPGNDNTDSARGAGNDNNLVGESRIHLLAVFL
jgi:hypothetical protein